ncbi:MAG: tRNA uridine-5-carboxymethylaminomethyl(34) synthesis GTPase MnmE [Alphaproteobacteria bacterium]|jgi:tRNA modification GTPase|nr:tRNA uridine-5-carboxymethylaminomethyl(34) synthesis GTPase MnmE [Alphaproteobacteria bacterium]
MQNTIYALSTPFISSAIAIIRVSGRQAFNSLKIISKKENFTSHKATHCNIYDINGELLDNALVLYFAEGHSYTGEILVEYHVHGSLSVIKDLLHTLSQMDGHRMAERGEFTRRALENGRLDLIQAEGIADLIAAETSQQRKQSLRELQGEVGSKYLAYGETLKETLALVESTIDFSDEDIPAETFSIANNNMLELISSMEKEIINGKKAKKLRDGISIAILGSPNVGKSSLINYLSNRDVAIVSNIAGTTRDIVEVFLDIGGFPVVLADTAGIRDTSDIIEKEGVRRAIAKASEADIKIVMLDAIDPTIPTDIHIDEDTFLLINKIDANPSPKFPFAGEGVDTVGGRGSGINLNPYLVSVSTGTGLADFETAIVEKLSKITAMQENPIVLQERHNEILQSCLEDIKLALANNHDIIICAFHLRAALNNIGKILGKTDIEEILDIIFGRFCIGK